MSNEATHGKIRESFLSRDIYFSDGYFRLEQLFSFSHQIHEIWKFQPSDILEIGVGNGFVSSYLKSSGIKVLTVDINENLNPDICASIEELPRLIQGRHFDLVSCCEVLEHMPYEEFERNLDIIRSLSDRAFITLPSYSSWYGFTGRVILPKWKKSISLGLRLRRNKELGEGHYWEIGSCNQTRRSKVIEALKKRFSKIQHGVFTMNRYHEFFSCVDN